MAAQSKGGTATPAAPSAPSAPSVPAVSTVFGPPVPKVPAGNKQILGPGAQQAKSKGGTAVPAGGTAVIPVAGGVASVDTSVPDPRDAQYWAEEAKRQFDIGQQRATISDQEGIDRRNYAEALRQLQAAQPLQERSAKESYNKAGLFYSGKLGEALNTLATSFAQRRGQAQTEMTDRDRARAAARAALDAGYPIDVAASYAAAVDRQVGRDSEAADAGALAANPTFAAPPPPTTTVARPKAATTTRPKVVVKSGWVYHYYPDGRKVRVRKAN